MPSEQDVLLRKLIDGVVQRPQFNAMGRPVQVVVVSFTTPHDFTGTVTMPLSEWTDLEKRAQNVMQAVVDLEGPFWNPGEAMTEGG